MISDKSLLESIEKALDNIALGNRALNLYEPIHYTLESGGKRLRPILALNCCGAYCGEPLAALNQALGVEMFHNFTLIHDDVMDRSPRRRGRETVYRRWGDVQAILSGDALLTLATMQVVKDAGSHTSNVLELFNRTAMEVYEGQQLDTEFENRLQVTIDEYIEMIRLKTSVLLGGACAIGSVMGNASQNDINALYRFGEALGLAFQLRDDWLDVYGKPEIFGKSIGNDIITRKKTWLYVKACEEAESELNAIYDSGIQGDQLIKAVTGLYDRLDLATRCDREIARYAATAVESLPVTLPTEYREWFESLASDLSSRDK